MAVIDREHVLARSERDFETKLETSRFVGNGDPPPPPPPVYVPVNALQVKTCSLYPVLDTSVFGLG